MSKRGCAGGRSGKAKRANSTVSDERLSEFLSSSPFGQLNSQDHNPQTDPSGHGHTTTFNQTYFAKPNSGGIHHVRMLVDELLQTTAQNMTPLEHFLWASQLPPTSDVKEAPAYLRSAVEEAEHMTADEIHTFRLTSWLKWAVRKEELRESWNQFFLTLPRHIRMVLGPEKNLFLFEEMLVAAGSPDVSLIRALIEGFRLTGLLDRSGTLKEVPYDTGMLTRGELQTLMDSQNAKIVSKP